MLNPNLIEPAQFAAQAKQLHLSFALSDLDERVWSHEYLADKNATIELVLTGGIDRWQRPYLDLALKGEFRLQCQRCMSAMPFQWQENAKIVLFSDEEKLDEAMLADDELEGMLMSDELDVRELVEDQILMAMPYSPRHEDCANEALVQVNQDKPNPFAALAGLKRNS
ncbi:MAG: YceD family protein [Neisseria sp.]|nr:YceD family protein [Neisseria sp.]